MLPSAKPRFLRLLQLKGQHPSHPRHSSFSREQQQLHPVKLWPLPCQMSTAPAAFSISLGLQLWPPPPSLPPQMALGQWLCLCTWHSIHVSTGPEICMTLHHPLSHICKTIQMREQHRSDTESLCNGISQHPVHPGDPPAISILVHCCL